MLHEASICSSALTPGLIVEVLYTRNETSVACTTVYIYQLRCPFYLRGVFVER